MLRNFTKTTQSHNSKEASFLKPLCKNFVYGFSCLSILISIFPLEAHSQVNGQKISVNTATNVNAVPITTDSRIKTLVYNPNEVYQLKFHYGYQSYIEFADDEEIEMISIGESFAWRLTPAGKRLFVRPLEIAAHTNMTIITNRRTYQFDIRSGEYNGRADEELVYIVRFYYPEIGGVLPIPSQLSTPMCQPAAPLTPMPAQPQPQSRSLVREASPPARVNEPIAPELTGNPNEARLNFDYSFAGPSENIAPTKVYDNGKETFFQFKNNNLIVPTISTVDIFGTERALNYVIRENYVIVPMVDNQFTLRLADSLICVFNNNLVTPPIPTKQ